MVAGSAVRFRKQRRSFLLHTYVRNSKPMKSVSSFATCLCQSTSNGNSKTARSERSHSKGPWRREPTTKNKLKAQVDEPDNNFILKAPLTGPASPSWYTACCLREVRRWTWPLRQLARTPAPQESLVPRAVAAQVAPGMKCKLNSPTLPNVVLAAMAGEGNGKPQVERRRPKMCWMLHSCVCMCGATKPGGALMRSTGGFPTLHDGGLPNGEVVEVLRGEEPSLVLVVSAKVAGTCRVRPRVFASRGGLRWDKF